ncbi:MAG: DUF1549 domain-containing protein [Verrucomicrobiales bacterium]|nr:DUF1549 domain-containing protein [Verrucomicrobiales bacterium]
MIRLLFGIAIFFWISGVTNADVAERSRQIDQLVESNLAKHKLSPNEAIPDQVFLRRAYLSIGGRIPTIEEAEAFLSEPESTRRSRLISGLLQGEAFQSHFYNFWADIFRMTDEGPSRNAFLHYQFWLKNALKENLPFDQMAYQLVSARGKTWENGATGYYHRDRGMPLDNMSNTVRIFLGTRLECAQCHNHPFDKWTQMDYYKMAAFSYSIDARDIYTYAPNRINAGRFFKERKKQAYLEGAGLGDGFPMPSLDRLEIHIEKHSKSPHDRWIGGKGTMSADEFRSAVQRGWAAAKKEDDLQYGAYWAGVLMYKPLLRYSVVEKDQQLKLPHDYQYDDASPLDTVQPATMFGSAVDIENHDGAAIEAYAKWLTSHDTPRFTRVIANRLWKFAFGAGIFEPVDDLTDYTNVSNPELLAFLEGMMVELKYDMRAFLEVLYHTQSWQRSADRGEVYPGAPNYFAGPALRRMSAEQIWDSMVAMCIPAPERYKPLLKSQLKSLEQERLRWTSLEGRDFDGYVKMMERLAPLVKEQRSETERISFAMTGAKVAGNEEEYQAYKKELKELNQKVDKAINEIGLIDLHKARSGGELLGEMLGMKETQMNTEMMAGDTMVDRGSSETIFTSLPAIDLPEPPEGLSKNEQRDWIKEQQKELRNFKGLVSRMARASELEMPAPRGHFLRDFGQSDREVIQNASTHASVPQALNLLNGQMIEALTNRFAVFGRRLERAETSDEKIQLIFQAMLTREPTPKEWQLARAEVAGGDEERYRGLVWVLLNTRQFLFIQ